MQENAPVRRNSTPPRQSKKRSAEPEGRCIPSLLLPSCFFPPYTRIKVTDGIFSGEFSITRR